MEIVKLSPIAVPARNKYGLDKIGVGEAAVFDLNEVDLGALRASVMYMRKPPHKKRFSVQQDRINRKIICYRIG